MDNQIVILRSHGGGGAWLYNLIYHLEKNDTSLPVVGQSFDDEPTSSIRFGHSFDYVTPNTIVEYDWSKYRKILFSTNKPFNLYLNEGSKIQLNPKILNKISLPFEEQFDTLTNTSVGWITDPVVHKHYYTNIDLDYQLIFQKPDTFVDNLFSILDSTNLQYTKNKDYCLQSIEHYKKTCMNPDTIIGNLNNLYWLAWCHGLKMINKIPLAFNFMEAKSMDEVASALTPIQDECIELTQSLYFKWNE